MIFDENGNFIDECSFSDIKEKPTLDQVNQMDLSKVS